MIILHSLLSPDFWSNGSVQVAFVLGSGTAIVSAMVGVFTIIRGHTFAGHALADISGVGGSASFLLGLNPLLGFAVMGILGATGIEMASSKRNHDRNIATGIALGAGLALSALFLHLNTLFNSASGTTFTVMFGSMWTIPSNIVPWALGMGIISILAMLMLFRPLLLSCVDTSLALSRGINVSLINLVYLIVLALSTALSSLTIGAILSTALLIGPAATALQICKRPGWAIVLACMIGLCSVWLGIVLAYDSFYWTPGHGWPVSFFIVMVLFITYLTVTHLPAFIASIRKTLAQRSSTYRCGH